MAAEQLLELLMHGNQLKRTARTGWGQRGVADPEDVAAHSFGVIYTALLLLELAADPTLDRAAVLAMATLHDLPEGLTTDIPVPAWRFLPAGAKATAERQALAEIVGDAAFGPQWVAWWEEYRRNETAAAQLVHDADKLDQCLQAYVYERHTGNRQLAEFWRVAPRFHLAPAQAIYDELRRARAALMTAA